MRVARAIDWRKTVHEFRAKWTLDCTAENRQRAPTAGHQNPQLNKAGETI